MIAHLKPSKIVTIMKDPEASAKAVHLVYTTDAETTGIPCKKTGKTYFYYKEEIIRINNLVIPHVWTGYCNISNIRLPASLLY